MDFEESLVQLDQNITFDDYQEDKGFGLNEQEIK